LAYWIAKPAVKLPLIIAALLVGAAAVTFRGVALDFRNRVWFSSQHISQSRQATIMLQLAAARVEKDGLVRAVEKGFATTAGRSAIMDLFANLVRRTPVEVPYWGGETYLSLVGALVPRILWPTKPTKELGQAFGHRYGYIYRTNMSTAINLPFMVEFFANFGGIGVMCGMILVGAIYRVLDGFANRRGQGILMSMMAVVLFLPVLLLESDFSLTFGGLPLNALALVLVFRLVGMKRGTVSRRARRYELRPSLIGQRTPTIPASHQSGMTLPPGSG
jgi:hypothetical protein